MDLVYRIRAVRLVQNIAVRYKWLRAPATKRFAQQNVTHLTTNTDLTAAGVLRSNH
jgi:hypothetical protein